MHAALQQQHFQGHPFILDKIQVCIILHSKPGKMLFWMLCDTFLVLFNANYFKDPISNVV